MDSVWFFVIPIMIFLIVSLVLSVKRVSESAEERNDAWEVAKRTEKECDRLREKISALNNKCGNESAKSGGLQITLDNYDKILFAVHKKHGENARIKKVEYQGCKGECDKLVYEFEVTVSLTSYVEKPKQVYEYQDKDFSRSKVIRTKERLTVLIPESHTEVDALYGRSLSEMQCQFKTTI